MSAPDFSGAVEYGASRQGIKHTHPKHPEDTCQICDGPNVVWFAPNELWNKHAMSRGYGIICPTCFARLVADDGVEVVWKFSPEL
jgi:hypothetical protein